MPGKAAIDADRLTRLLGGGELAELRQRLRKRYARPEPPDDTFTLTGLERVERDALAGLLGRRRRPAASMRLSHRAMDQALNQAGLASDLRRALEYLDGPITDATSQRARERRAWAALFARAPSRALTAALARPVDQGVLKRLAHGEVGRASEILTQTQRVLEQLPATGITRSQLAADTLGDAHGLDSGSPVATLLRRALDPERRHTRWRDVWAEQGVMVSELAKPVVVLNLRVLGDSPVERLLEAARQAGEPLHVSLRQLLRTLATWRKDQSVHVCENPDVLAAAADELGAECPPMVSLDGQLSAAPRTLLDQLHAAGCWFHYHGDFDWPGLAIGNGIVGRYGATPWRFSAVDYAPEQGPALRGEPVEAAWDGNLAEKMRVTGLAVHEEAQLPILLHDLARHSMEGG